MNKSVLKGYGILGIAGFCLFLGSTAIADPVGKTMICHKPGERNQRTLEISLEKDGAKHESHGDEIPLKECDIPGDNKDNDCDATTLDGGGCDVQSEECSIMGECEPP